MHCKMNSVLRQRLVFVIFAVIFFWTTLRIFYSRQPPSLTRVELSEDGSSTVITLLPVLIEVYYEALCPDSRSFLLTQLLPTFEKIPEAMNLQLIPYGKAKTTPSGKSYKFECQHGPTECLANKVHACGMNIISNPETRIQYAACMIADNWNPESAGSSCAKKYDIDWESIWTCAKGNQGSNLLALYGKKTDKIGYINFIPTIALQGSTENQPAILKNLQKEICHLYKEDKPDGCSKVSNE
ncbi:gamma-interferon-inducible lysosomal thiol reductase-like [Thrips palmi]|uniref:Gamma-interferon-inducible lysosomal thiol reductase-like n=1 Tax=Thrips palmi TaxID=161013 RepID=A0A6P8YKH4_THRPL|nr:gamma-interferon-inducible lysosomal thiol reductase-like [Thrips palmi]